MPYIDIDLKNDLYIVILLISNSQWSIKSIELASPLIWGHGLMTRIVGSAEEWLQEG